MHKQKQEHTRPEEARQLLKGTYLISDEKITLMETIIGIGCGAASNLSIQKPEKSSSLPTRKIRRLTMNDLLNLQIKN